MNHSPRLRPLAGAATAPTDNVTAASTCAGGRLGVIFGAAILLGTALRLLAAAQGFNYDLDSYWIVSDLVLRGDSVYAGTTRYNYGPVWYLILGALRKFVSVLSLDDKTSFHIAVAGFLTVVDIVIAGLLKRRFGLAVALCFFLNPISILITGYHSQFDNLAIVFGLCGCLLIDRGGARMNCTGLFGAALLGFSLAAKHILIVFPLWTALLLKKRDAPTRDIALALTVPAIIFGASFLLAPWDVATWSGIGHNVFGYASAHGRGIFVMALDFAFDIRAFETASHVNATKYLFLAAMAALGWWWIEKRRLCDSLTDLLALYLAAVVVFSTAMEDQYLAIPLITIAIFYRFPSAWVYTAAGLAIIIESRNNVFGEAPAGQTLVAYHHAQIVLGFLLWQISRTPAPHPPRLKDASIKPAAG